MSSVELTEIEKKVIPNCKFFWSQRVTNQAQRIITDCDTEEKRKQFFDECQSKIKNGDKNCRIIWNNEVQKFGGDEFGYIWFFYSEMIDSPIKISVKINVFEQTVFIGNIDIADKREELKLDKHLSSTSLNNPKAINSQEVAQKNG